MARAVKWGGGSINEKVFGHTLYFPLECIFQRHRLYEDLTAYKMQLYLRNQNNLQNLMTEIYKTIN